MIKASIYLIPFCLISFNSFSEIKYTFKGNYLINTTSNVDSSSTTPINDSYSDFIAAIQAKNDTFKFKFKFKNEKYKKTKSYDNSSFDISTTYKRTKNNDYTVAFSKLTYKGVPANISDTTSDNTNIKIATSFTHTINKTDSSYFSVSLAQKNYPTQNRKDPIIDLSFGYEGDFLKKLTINPELLIELNNSNSTTYRNINMAPTVAFIYALNDDLELNFNTGFTYTNYTNRTFSETIKNKTVQTKEHQGLVATEVGASYTLFDKLILNAKYTTNRNSSNNPTSEYNSNIFSFNFGFRF
jgi:hypothetical protein